ncbi:MAG: DUF1080 domain-containing protein [Phycisphaerales bacterium]|nr:DUF1080 domain-containing protein [Phycisphaerales bacterium]
MNPARGLFRAHKLNRAAIAVAALLGALLGAKAINQSESWGIHDMKRPQPTVVAPSAQCGGAPSDAVVLFDGANLSKWKAAFKDADAGWSVRDGIAQVAPGSGDISTRDSFGDCQFHMEWMVPKDLKCAGQHGCNSGVFFMNQYELQILNSNNNVTYCDGMAGAMYGQYPPLVNACKPQGEWNVYDIVFRAPKFNDDGSLAQAGTMTVLFNGILVQDASVIRGSTAHAAAAKYTAHADRLPIRLQDHGDALCFRNMWVRPLAAHDS